ncbi:alcohol oxidase [Panus rudis PR-1116 ss-1]|nr:alcohol oxidase [Panus rudis PR-1116 ss-1]
MRGLLYALLYCSISTVRGKEVDADTFAHTSFDYVVVGGGTTGLAVASRLSDDPNVIVGVIEAGAHKEDNNILIPAFAFNGLGDPAYDWLLTTLPQTQLANRTLVPFRGKVLGGTSAINTMQYTKASSVEYDAWRTVGNPGWSFDELQPFMKRAERWTPPEPQTVKPYANDNHAPDHGRDGRIHTTGNANFTDVITQYLDALENLSGLKRNFSPLDGNPIGSFAATVEVDAKNRSRSYAANGYYEPFASRSNFVVLTEAQGSKIHFENTTGSADNIRATGVQFVSKDNKTYTVSASREVIVSAGSLKSPQVLELSGIGNADFLKRLGIEPIIDLPGVGENLQDHVLAPVVFQTLPNLITYGEATDPALLPLLMQEYVQNRTGLLSGVNSMTAFLPPSKFIPAAEQDTIKKALDDALQQGGTTTDAIKAQREFLDNDNVPQLEIVYATGNNGGNDTSARFYTFAPAIMHSFARGSVHLASSDPLAPPIIDPRYFESPGDVDRQIFIRGIRHVLEVSQTEPLRSFTLGIVSNLSLNATDDEIVAYLAENASSDSHFVGSAAMLPREQGGVVDPNFLVYGTANVRVVDASIFPFQLGTHPTATLYGIGEKAAEVIRGAKAD